MRKPGVLFVGALAALVGLAGLSAPAFAQTDAQKAKAREHFQNGRRLYDVGRYPEAIKEYEQAYLNVEDPVFLFNIAQAYRLDGQLDEAIRSYRAYLRRAPDAQNRTDVESRIAELQREVEAQKRQNNPAPASPPPPPPTTPVVQSAPAPVVTEPVPAPVAAPEVQPIAVTNEVDVVDDDAQRLARRRRTGYVLLAGGGGGILLATIFGAIANGKASELEKAEVFDKDLEDAGKTASAAAVVLGLGGTIAAGIGVYYLMSSQRAAGSSASADPQPRAAKAALSFALTPVVGLGYTGAGAALRF